MPLPPQMDAETAQESQYFYGVALHKLILLWLGTLGLYGLYWFHRHWQTIAAREGGGFSPLGRTLLAGSWCEPLLRQIADAAAAGPTPADYRPRLRAALWLLMTACLLLPPPYSLMCPLAVLPLVAAQRAANGVNAWLTPAADRNAAMSRREWLAVTPAGVALAFGLGKLYLRFFP